MLTTITDDLAGATIAGWYARLAGSACPQRNHWQTKVIYYRAVAELLAAQPDRPLTWKTIVGAAHGRRSTFYEVAGRHARHGMVRELIDDGTVRSYEIALRYGRPSPVELLIDEAKVWSFWPYRQQFVATAPGLDALRDAVVAWARLNPALAAANAFRPPACAVEDLVLLYEGRLAASRAEHRLTEVLRTTLPL
ncbi:hypothetical protein [Actinoplanes couchii]|uniref:Uncharacterized protein n=1 Tax=Actinoplanes couchii TaxID=403638 RepID=A0ABQ3X3U4_9ACTN|nr:hypothetical protein [Actinoplanes couchii]MDR6322942.1 hypothetical protein [Actinoplanes couchii]GID53182.1 hypothetical protein Aco03nite_015860 [Actinoplanes couchii]